MNRLPDSLVTQLAPRSLGEYLEARGWGRDPLPRSDIWQYVSPAERFPILVPASRSLTDYCRMTRRTLEALADYEGREVIDVFEQALSRCDIVSCRVQGPEIKASTIPIGTAVSFVETIQDLLIYSASSELRREKSFPKKIVEAIRLASKSRFGQTSLGSFVVRFFVPLPRRKQESLFEDAGPRPIERRTVLRLVEGMSKVREAAAADDYRILVDNYETGLNANMCESIVEILKSQEVDSFGLAANLDPTWFAEDMSPSVEVFSNSIAVISRAAAELRGSSEVSRVQVDAWVYQLHHEGRIGDDQKYQIRILWEDEDDAVYKILVSLSHGDYQEALRAHAEGKRVKLEGDLQRVGRYWHLLGPENFNVVEDTIEF